MTHEQWRDQLDDLLRQQQTVTADLLAALARETDALSGLDPAALDTASARKRCCITALDGLEQERRRICAALGHPADTEGMQAMLAQLEPGGTRLAGQWNELLTQLAECRSRNRTNGALVQIQRHQVSGALNILRGGCDADTMYDPSGQTLNHRQGVPLAQA